VSETRAVTKTDSRNLIFFLPSLWLSLCHQQLEHISMSYGAARGVGGRGGKGEVVVSLRRNIVQAHSTQRREGEIVLRMK
jgi:hypothetical protein